MFVAVYILYLLLCLPVTVRAALGVNDVQSTVRLSVGALLAQADFEGVLERRGTLALRLKPRYGGGKGAGLPGLRRGTIRAARPFVRAVLDAASWQTLEIRLRLGLEEAWSTAVAAGAVRALARALLAGLRRAPPCDLRVDADFRAPCMVMTARCIFSVRAGDIMLAAVKTAVKKTQKEGVAWISIPSRAS